LESTFTIDVTGCFVVGAVIAVFVDRHRAPLWLRLGLTMGLVGGYTTFSTYARETLDPLEEGKLTVALTYGLGSVVVGMAAVLLGLRLRRLV
jgi:CrcB protein